MSILKIAVPALLLAGAAPADEHQSGTEIRQLIDEGPTDARCGAGHDDGSTRQRSRWQRLPIARSRASLVADPGESTHDRQIEESVEG